MGSSPSVVASGVVVAGDDGAASRAPRREGWQRTRVARRPSTVVKRLNTFGRVLTGAHGPRQLAKRKLRQSDDGLAFNGSDEEGTVVGYTGAVSADSAALLHADTAAWVDETPRARRSRRHRHRPSAAPLPGGLDVPFLLALREGDAVAARYGQRWLKAHVVDIDADDLHSSETGEEEVEEGRAALAAPAAASPPRTLVIPRCITVRISDADAAYDRDGKRVSPEVHSYRRAEMDRLRRPEGQALAASLSRAARRKSRQEKLQISSSLAAPNGAGGNGKGRPATSDEGRAIFLPNKNERVCVLVTRRRDHRAQCDVGQWRGARVYHRWRRRVLTKRSTIARAEGTATAATMRWSSVQQWRVRVAFDAPWDAEGCDVNLSIPLSARELSGAIALRGEDEREDDERYEDAPQSSIYEAAHAQNRLAPAAGAARLIALGEFALRAPPLVVAEKGGGRATQPNLRLNPLRLASMSGADAAPRAPLYPLVGGRSAAVEDSTLRLNGAEDDAIESYAVRSPITRSALAAGSYSVSRKYTADDAADDADADDVAQPAIVMGWRKQTRVSCNFRGEGRWFYARVVAVHFVQSSERAEEGEGVAHSPPGARLTPTLQRSSGLIQRLRSSRNAKRGTDSNAAEEAVRVSFMCEYDVLYEDGDAEYDIPANFLRDDRYSKPGVGPHRLAVSRAALERARASARSAMAGLSSRGGAANGATADSRGGLAVGGSTAGSTCAGGRSEPWTYGAVALRAHVGLENLGNTCFLNSVVQCLVHLPRFAAFFLAPSVRWRRGAMLNPGSNSKGDIALAMRDLTRKMDGGGGGSIVLSRRGHRSSTTTAVSPSKLKRVVGQLRPQFRGYEQHDSHEFLRFVLEGIHEDLNAVRGKVAYVEMRDDPGATDAELSRRWWEDYGRWNDSPIKTIFAGQLASSVTCTYCRHVSKSFDPFWDLSLPIPTGSGAGGSAGVGGRSGSGEDAVPLAECLRAFLTAEQLTGENRFHCPRCKRDRECTKLLRVSRSPKVLVVHLKRFVFNRWNSAKITAAVSFPLYGLRLGGSASGSSNGSGDDDERSGAAIYDLVGVSNHIGSLTGGHYTADATTDVDGGEWKTFDDARVSTSRGGYGGGQLRRDVASSTAYLLFYSRRE